MTSSPSTDRGRATRARILTAAAALMAERGAAGTSLDDIRARTGSSKSQLYHYFGDKHGLIQAVIDHESALVLAAQTEALEGVQDWEDLERWVDWMVASVERQGGRGGCPIGTLAAALADADEQFRIALSNAFDSWRQAIGTALTQLRDNGLLTEDADLPQLTTAMLATIQGGLLLAKTKQDSTPLRMALDAAVARLRTYDTSARR